MAYGLPYMGSKNLIALELLQQMPRREWFVDLFAGGGAMWQAAAESGKYSRYLVNEYNEQQCDFLRDCALGIYDECNEWVSSSDFRRDISKSKFLQCIWSFGNKGSDGNYFCADVMEDFERALFYAYEFGDYSLFSEIGFAGDTVYLEDIKRRHDWYRSKYIEHKLEEFAHIEKENKQAKEQNNEIKSRFNTMLREAAKTHGLTGAAIDEYLGNNMWQHYTAKPSGQFTFPTRENYERLREIMPTLPTYDQAGTELKDIQNINYDIFEKRSNWHTSIPHRRLQSLRAFHKQCERLDIVRKTYFSAKSYDEVDIPENALIYCDPPYINTTGYGVEFNHARFYDWCRAQKELVLISEYSMPDDFIPIWRKQKAVRLCGGSANKAEEKLFIHKSHMPLLYKRNGGYQTKLWL